jgi:hypothetical protein
MASFFYWARRILIRRSFEVDLTFRRFQNFGKVNFLKVTLNKVLSEFKSWTLESPTPEKVQLPGV